MAAAAGLAAGQPAGSLPLVPGLQLVAGLAAVERLTADFAIARDVDLLLIDTAGRLHTKEPLMEELAKVRRVVEKAAGRAPDETLLVLDAMAGQDAVAADFQFHLNIVRASQRRPLIVRWKGPSWRVAVISVPLTAPSRRRTCTPTRRRRTCCR